MGGRAFFILAFCLIGTLAEVSQAQTLSCLPTYTALQNQIYLAKNQDFKSKSNLFAQNGAGLFESRVQLTWSYEAETQALQLALQFDPQFDGVSLPYNLQSVLVIENGLVVAWMDFTDQCTSSGVGFFPGSVFHLPKVKLPSRDATSRLQLMVWGRL